VKRYQVIDKKGYIGKGQTLADAVKTYMSRNEYDEGDVLTVFKQVGTVDMQDRDRHEWEFHVHV